MQQIKRGERSSRGSFNKQQGKQPQLHATGALKKARRESFSDYSKHEFMKTPQGGMWARFVIQTGILIGAHSFAAKTHLQRLVQSGHHQLPNRPCLRSRHCTTTTQPTQMNWLSRRTTLSTLSRKVWWQSHLHSIHFTLLPPLDPSGWWKGRLRGKEGVFPNNYIEKIWSLSLSDQENLHYFFHEQLRSCFTKSRLLLAAGGLYIGPNIVLTGFDYPLP